MEHANRKTVHMASNFLHDCHEWRTETEWPTENTDVFSVYIHTVFSVNIYNDVFSVYIYYYIYIYYCPML